MWYAFCTDSLGWLNLNAYGYLDCTVVLYFFAEGKKMNGSMMHGSLAELQARLVHLFCVLISPRQA